MAADPSRRQKRRENFPKLKSTHTINILYSESHLVKRCNITLATSIIRVKHTEFLNSRGVV